MIVKLYFVLAFILIYLKYINAQQCMTVETDGGSTSPTPCVFPFNYDNQVFNECTDIGDDKKWCSTRVDENGNHVTDSGEWGYCDLQTCQSNQPKNSNDDSLRRFCVTTSDGPSRKAGDRCIFPFRNNGRVYRRCTTDEADDGKPWCSIETDFNGNHLKGKWGHCDCSRQGCCEGVGGGDDPDVDPDDEKDHILPNIEDTARISGSENTELGFIDEGGNEPVIGGRESRVNLLPYQAAIILPLRSLNDRASVLCGGSLINQRYVLSAAHCFFVKDEPISPSSREILLGELTLNQDPDCQGSVCSSVQKVGIMRYFVHPRYQSPQDKRRDIVLIKLKKRANFGDNILPIFIPRPSTQSIGDPFTKVLVSGWGTTNFSTFTTATTLKLGVLKIFNFDGCEYAIELLGRSGYRSEMTICTADLNANDCNGDSGSALIQSYQRHFAQVGIVSFGIPRCPLGAPNFYTRVQFHYNWILDTIKN